jgi:hypothetical protein
MARKGAPPPEQPAVNTLADFHRKLDAALVIAATNPESLPGFGTSEGNPVTLAARIPTAAEMTARMVTNSQASGEHWLARTMQPRKEPLKEAAKANAKFKASVQKAVAEDRFLKGIQNADEAAMYETIKAGGSGAFTQGIAKRQGKITKAYDTLRPKLLAHVGVLDAMPTDTEQQRDAKVLANVQGMRKLRK